MTVYATGRHARRRTFINWATPALLALVSIVSMFSGLFVLAGDGIDIVLYFAPLSVLIFGGVTYGAMIAIVPGRIRDAGQD